MKGFISIKGLGRADLESLVDDTCALRAAIDSGDLIAKALDGVCVANVFFEASTRTRLSFDLAAQRLGAHVITFHPDTGSTAKGESLRDTARTISAIGADILVVRHAEAGVPQAVAEWTGLPVVNAGDGANEHPTQALVDAATIRRHFGRFDGLRMAIVGDIRHSRVSGSLMHALPLLGVDVRLIAPEEWLPDATTLATSTDLDGALADLDIVYLLRVQTERGGEVTDSYVRRYQLTPDRAARFQESVVVMHPGPLNRGVEIVDEVAESPRSLVIEQVRNGVPARMAVLRSLIGADT
jgi:aspartate carbamoyltransferase catalytic subunit